MIVHRAQFVFFFLCVCVKISILAVWRCLMWWGQSKMSAHWFSTKCFRFVFKFQELIGSLDFKSVHYSHHVELKILADKASSHLLSQFNLLSVIFSSLSSYFIFILPMESQRYRKSEFQNISPSFDLQQIAVHMN